MRISVLTYPEAGALRPCALHLGARKVPVASVLARWEGDGHHYFEVGDLAGRRFVVRQCARTGLWELEAVYRQAAL